MYEAKHYHNYGKPVKVQQDLLCTVTMSDLVFVNWVPNSYIYTYDNHYNLTISVC